MIKTVLVFLNLLILYSTFYFFSILNHHGPTGNESVAIGLYSVGVIVVFFDLLFIFKKREAGTNKINTLNIIFALLVFDQMVINSAMFFLVMSLMQL
jgi:hypothetical protein